MKNIETISRTLGRIINNAIWDKKTYDNEVFQMLRNFIEEDKTFSEVIENLPTIEAIVDERDEGPLGEVTIEYNTDLEKTDQYKKMLRLFLEETSGFIESFSYGEGVYFYDKTYNWDGSLREEKKNGGEEKTEKEILKICKGIEKEEVADAIYFYKKRKRKDDEETTKLLWGKAQYVGPYDNFSSQRKSMRILADTMQPESSRCYCALELYFRYDDDEEKFEQMLEDLPTISNIYDEREEGDETDLFVKYDPTLEKTDQYKNMIRMFLDRNGGFMESFTYGEGIELCTGAFDWEGNPIKKEEDEDCDGWY